MDASKEAQVLTPEGRSSDPAAADTLKESKSPMPRSGSFSQLSATAREFVPISVPSLQAVDPSLISEQNSLKIMHTSPIHAQSPRNYVLNSPIGLSDVQKTSFVSTMALANQSQVQQQQSPVFLTSILNQIAFEKTLTNSADENSHHGSKGLGILGHAVQGVASHPVLATPPQKPSSSKKNKGKESKHKHAGHGGEKLDEAEMLELNEKILKQVEFYFSDQNIVTDNFLLNQIKKDSEGFVPLSVLATFRKMKQLFPKFASLEFQISAISESISSSTSLVLSEDLQKVKRINPLPEVNTQELQERTVIVENLPPDHSVENLTSLFSRAGKVNLVRVCPPQATNSANNAKPGKFITTNKLHAMIEFDTPEAAEKAVRELNNSNDWRNGLRVRHLAMSQAYSVPKGHGSNNHNHKQKGGSSVQAQASDNSPSLTKQPGSSSSPLAVPAGGSLQKSQLGRQSQSPADQADSQKKTKKNSKRNSSSPVPSTSPKVPGHSPLSRSPLSRSPLSRSPLLRGEGFKPLPGPKMPDGTKGFTMGRGRKLPAPIPGKQGAVV